LALEEDGTKNTMQTLFCSTWQSTQLLESKRNYGMEIPGGGWTTDKHLRYTASE
jgi:hypothetical protein